MPELPDRYYLPAWKFFLIFILLFSAPFIHAQTENPVADTTVINLQVDSISSTQIENDSANNETEAERRTDYFLRKNGERNTLNGSIQLRHVPVNVIKQMKNDDDFWYADAVLKKPKALAKAIHSPLIEREWFQVLLWLIIIGGFAGFIIFYLANSETGLFRRRNKSIATASGEELETDNIFEINYQKEIEKAEEKGNYRLAVRLMFLRLLRDLSDKNIIQYKQGQTNFDYLLQLQPTSYYKDFLSLARNYEYSWYGQLAVKPGTFTSIKNDFINFEQKISVS